MARRLGLSLAACAAVLACPAPAGAAMVFAGGWGIPGTGDGELSAPGSVSVDSAGDVYVSEFNFSASLSRVQKFSPLGGFITKFGAFGAGDGQFYGSNVFAASPGLIYVVDEYNKRVHRFTAPSPFAVYTAGTPFASAGSGDGQLSSPRGAAVDSSENIYVADSGNERVQKFSSGGTYLDQFGGEGTADGEMQQPFDVAVGPGDRVYVADTSNHRVQEYTASGDFVRKWGGAGAGDGQFVHPWGIATDPAGNVYVADQGNDRIQKFSSTGTFIAKGGGGGTASGQLDGPTDLASNAAGQIYVLDSGNKRIQIFADDGGSSNPPLSPPVTKPPVPKPVDTNIYLWTLLPPNTKGCTSSNGQSCYVKIVVGAPGVLTLADPAVKVSAAAKRKKAKPGIRTVKRRVAKAGTVRVKLKLNAAASKVAKRKGKIKVRVRATWKPTGGAKATKTIRLTFRKKAKKRR